MKMSFVYMTARDKKEARKIGKALVEERLAACVNIIDKMNSIYWWKGKMEKAKEAVLIAKTKKALVPRLIKRVKSLHSYTCPCIVSLPILDGNKEYLRWIGDETR